MPSLNQKRGYRSNEIAREFLFDLGFKQIWLKSHQRFAEKVFFPDKFYDYRSKDIFGLWDGIGFDRENNLVFVQISTNKWKRKTPFEIFFKDKKNISGIEVLVKYKYKYKNKKRKKAEVEYRVFP